MKPTKSLIITAVWGLITMCDSFASADVLRNTSYTETPSAFAWLFEWNRTIPDPQEFLRPEGRVLWLPILALTAEDGQGGNNDMVLNAIHNSRADIGDAPQSDEFKKTLLNATFPATSDSWAEGFSEGVGQLSNPEPHSDNYQLIYKSENALGTIQFQFSGFHLDTQVPAPGSLALLGLAGVTAMRRRRR